MAGHSKWNNTKHRKAVQDTKRNKIFTKIIRELITAARLGGDNPITNPRLRSAIDKALANNMTRETINRAVTRGIGMDENIDTETIMYEGYGPGGAAIMVECFSNNRNRTIAEIRHAFSKYGCSLSSNGSVSYLFKKKGVISFESISEDIIINAALEVNAEDMIIYNNGVINIYTNWNEVDKILNEMEEISGLKASSVEISMIPSIKVSIDAENIQKFLHLISMLKNCSDAKKVYHNGDIHDETTFSF